MIDGAEYVQLQLADKAGLLPDVCDIIGHISSTIAATGLSPQAIDPAKFRPKYTPPTEEEIQAREELERSKKEVLNMNFKGKKNG